MNGLRSLAGHRVLITGAARGMGRSHALLAAEHGASVGLIDVPAAGAALADTAAEAAKLGGATIAARTADIRDADLLGRAIDEIAAELGGLDGLVANAGVSARAKSAVTWETSSEEWERIVRINLSGTFHTVRAAIPHLLRSGSGGSIVLIASTAGERPLPFAAAYSASKAGVIALGRTLAQELGAAGVRCNSVLPGAVSTPMTDDVAAREGITREAILDAMTAEQLLHEVITPVAVSDTVVWLLSDQSRLVTGIEVKVDAGLTGRNARVPGR